MVDVSYQVVRAYVAVRKPEIRTEAGRDKDPVRLWSYVTRDHGRELGTVEPRTAPVEGRRSRQM